MVVAETVVWLQVNDISLEDYIAVKSKNAVFVPHTAGRYQKKRFRKAQCPIVERYVQSWLIRMEYVWSFYVASSHYQRSSHGGGNVQ